MLKLRAAKVAIEDATPLDAFITGATWNGWECPYFTRQQGEALLKCPEFEEGRYDPKRDAFVFECTSDPECDDEVYPAVEVDGVKYYGIGAGCWIWSLAAETDEDGDYIQQTDPWEGDFSRGAWHALNALVHAYVNDAVERGHRGKLELPPDIARLSAASRVCEDEAELRTLLVEGLAAADERGLTVSDKLREHIGIVAAGGNPWA